MSVTPMIRSSGNSYGCQNNSRCCIASRSSGGSAGASCHAATGAASRTLPVTTSPHNSLYAADDSGCVVRNTFTVMDLHHLLPAGLPALHKFPFRDVSSDMIACQQIRKCSGCEYRHPDFRCAKTKVLLN